MEEKKSRYKTIKDASFCYYIKEGRRYKSVGIHAPTEMMHDGFWLVMSGNGGRQTSSIPWLIKKYGITNVESIKDIEILPSLEKAVSIVCKSILDIQKSQLPYSINDLAVKIVTDLYSNCHYELKNEDRDKIE